MTLAEAIHEARGMSWQEAVAFHVLVYMFLGNVTRYVVSRDLPVCPQRNLLCTIRSYARMP